MFSKKNPSVLRSITFRLTFLYAALFGALSIALFAIVYISLASNLEKQMDNGLSGKAREFELLYASRGIKALHPEFQRETEARGTRREFIRFLSESGEVLAASNMSAWRGLKGSYLHPQTSRNGAVSISTVSVPGHTHRVRLIRRQTGDGHVIQMGVTLMDSEGVMGKYRETFAATLAVLLLSGGLVGWLMARRAMSGVERVTQAASRIGKGDLARRVAPGHEGLEIDALAMAFNAMLERIQALVNELREVTDNVAHDLRSPITRIRGIAEITMSGEQDVEAYREMAATVVEESDRLVGMINTMLDIAKTDSGVAELSMKSLDMREIIDEAGELFQPVGDDRGVRIDLHFPPEPLFVVGDKAMLQRMVANLLDNAIKYTPSGGKVAISAIADAACVRIEFTDTGVGIEEKELSHIFGRFYRGDKSRSTPGSGLGLSLALAIARAHGGGISATSTPGVGSSFNITLPLSSPHPSTVSSATQ